MAHKVPMVLVVTSVALALASGARGQTVVPATPPAAQTTGAQAASPGASTDSLTAAQQALTGGQYKLAQSLFEAAIARDYQNAEAHFGLGLALFRQNDLTGARFEFGQLIKLAPERFEGLYNLGVIAAKQGQYDEALADYQKALELAQGKASPAPLRQLYDALAAEQTRRAAWPELVKTLTDATALSPDDLSLSLRLADATLRAGDADSALPLAYGVLNKDPSSVPAALLVADIYAGQGLPERAARVLYDALGRQSGAAARTQLLTRQGLILAAAGKNKDALKSLQDAVKASPSSAEAQLALAGVCASSGDKLGAVAAYHAAVKADPSNAASRVQLAGAELAAGQTAQAAGDAALALKAAKDAPTRARAQYILGVTAYAQGRYAQARSQLQASAQVLPDAGTSLWLGLSSYALKDYPAAVVALQASVQASPSLTARANLGAALLAAGRYQEAQATLQGVVGDAPKNALAWYQLGWAARNLGQNSQARSAFKTALTLGYAPAREALK